MHESTARFKRDTLRSRGFLTLEDYQLVVEAVTGRRFHLDTLRAWHQTGRFGHVLPVDSAAGRILIKFSDGMDFLKLTGLLRDDVRDAVADNSEFPIPMPPAHENSELTRNLDRLAVYKSRKERLAAAERLENTATEVSENSDGSWPKVSER